MDKNLIAPCGMNCSLCLTYQRKKNPCLGCRIFSQDKRKYCTECIIINCDKRVGKDANFCYSCDAYPCKRLKNLDKRYRTKYNMSMLENLAYIKKHGIDTFTENEKKRWKCENCGELICVHRGCLHCGDKKQ